ncbi:MAG: hypothetical protein NE327_22605 [Lentisphaeraceae bacterium]|nr:hypothetical protein [Lentisphaeraceae bacterium]
MNSIPILLLVVIVIISSNQREKELSKLRSLIVEKYSAEELERLGVKIYHDKPGVGVKLLWLAIIFVPIALILWSK